MHGATTELLTEIDGPKRVELPPMFSWLSNSIPDYPETLNLQMYAHIKELGERPTFELEPTDHPLSVEYYEGITPERVKEIMMRRLDMPEMRSYRVSGSCTWFFITMPNWSSSTRSYSSRLASSCS